MERDDRDTATEDNAITTSGVAGDSGEADGVKRLRVRVAGPPVFSRSVCSLLGDTPWIEDVAPLTAKASGATGSAAAAIPRSEDLRAVDVLLVAVPGTAALVRHLTEARGAHVPLPALALLTVGGRIFRSEMAVAGRLGIRVFLSVRDGADTLRGGVRAAMRGENYCSPDLRSLQKEIAQILAHPTDTSEITSITSAPEAEPDDANGPAATTTPTNPTESETASSPEDVDDWEPPGEMPTASPPSRPRKPNVPGTARRQTPTGPG